jgi:hypothetical protein
VPRQQSSGLLVGALVVVLTIAVGASAAWGALHLVAAPATPPPPSRETWYATVAQGFVDRHRAGQPGFELPHHLSEVTGVHRDASPEVLVWGIEHYLQVALFTGYPSYMGILAWARQEFGEYPGGAAPAEAWIRQAAETFAQRSLQGRAGYVLTDALLTTGGINPGERDPAVVAAGVERALRAGLYLGTPTHGGLLDWARRTYGELPPE